MKKPIKHTNTNFWFGFVFGIASAAGASYLLGTKNGREKLKKLLEYAEQYGENPEELMQMLESLSEEKTKELEPIKTNLNTLMDKVKSITEGKK